MSRSSVKRARRGALAVGDILADPFFERLRSRGGRTLQLLGAQFRFRSNSARLLELVDVAYAGLPRHRLGEPATKIEVGLLLGAGGGATRRPVPAALSLGNSASHLIGATPGSSLVIASAAQRTALVVVSPDMLAHPYHVRYEFIEFAVFTLAARVQGLVPLHAACVGHRGRGLVLMGGSGAGKSTISMLWALQGLDFLAEDSVFVAPATMAATGVANFLHVRPDSLRFVTSAAQARALRRSPSIRRRSGVQKLEIDLRQTGWRLARAPLDIAAIVFLTSEPAGRHRLLAPLSKAQLSRRTLHEQPYAAGRAEWPLFRGKLAAVPAFELRRGGHPLESVDALRALLETNVG